MYEIPTPRLPPTAGSLQSSVHIPRKRTKRGGVCIPCRKSKVKCNVSDGQPRCARCNAKRLTCEWSRSSKAASLSELEELRAEVARLKGAVQGGPQGEDLGQHASPVHTTTPSSHLRSRTATAAPSDTATRGGGLFSHGEAVPESAVSHAIAWTGQDDTTDFLKRIDNFSSISPVDQNLHPLFDTSLLALPQYASSPPQQNALHRSGGCGSHDVAIQHSGHVPVPTTLDPPTSSERSGIVDSIGSPQGVMGHLAALLSGSSGKQERRRTSVATEAMLDESPTRNDRNLGSEDPRSNIVKRGVVDNETAMGLIHYFQDHLAPGLFGFQVGLGLPPMRPSGASTISPFMLAVLCFIAAGHRQSSESLAQTLAEEVDQLLSKSPADNPFGLVNSSDPLVFAGPEGTLEPELDPELGIGPEEVLGAALLALFQTDRTKASILAATGFRWVRGFIRGQSGGQLPPTLGELCGVLPSIAPQSREDTARLFLFCYVVSGMESLHSDQPPSGRHGVMEYCSALVPNSLPDGAVPALGDIILVFHARLILIVQDWVQRRNLRERDAVGEVSESEHAHLASVTNAKLEWWRADLTTHHLSATQSQSLDLIWQFVRMLVNVTAGKLLISRSVRGLSKACMGSGADAALVLLDVAANWSPSQHLPLLPATYMTMIKLAAAVLCDTIHTSRTFLSTNEVSSLLNKLAAILKQGQLVDNHPSRETSDSILKMVRELTRS